MPLISCPSRCRPSRSTGGASSSIDRLVRLPLGHFFSSLAGLKPLLQTQPKPSNPLNNTEHLEILRAGSQTWNQWREQNSSVILDFRDADLRDVGMSCANLRNADLRHARMDGAQLVYADLRDADLRHADLRHARMDGADLSYADLRHANLARAWLDNSKLYCANLAEATLARARLNNADLQLASLVYADLSGAWLDGADVSRAKFLNTTLADTKLNTVSGLESIKHEGPSSIGLDTFFRSQGKIPEVFLRGAGVPDIFLQYASSLAGQPFEFYSCFLSYSTQDEDFASRLHNDFQANGIRCWKWDHDARTGRSLWGEIDSAIRVYEKLVLIASEASLKSPAVIREIERALVQEDARMKRKLSENPAVDCDVLFPIRLDDFIFKGWNHERKVDVTKKAIADAREWANDSAVYPRVLEKLLRDLKSEKSKSNVEICSLRAAN